MNENILQQIDADIQRLTDIIDTLEPLRDSFPENPAIRTSIERRLRQAESDRTDAGFQRAHIKAMTVQITAVSDDELNAMRQQLEALDTELRKTQQVQALLNFTDAAVQTIQTHLSKFPKAA